MARKEFALYFEIEGSRVSQMDCNAVNYHVRDFAYVIFRRVQVGREFRRVSLLWFAQHVGRLPFRLFMN